MKKIRRLIRLVKVCTLFFLFSVSGVCASTYAQNYRISINKQNASILEILREIENESEFTFFVNDNQVDVNKRVNVDVQDASVEEVLKQALEGTDYKYDIIDRQILIKTGNESDASAKTSTVASKSPQQAGKKITGHVKDNFGDEVIGANVVVQGTTNGTITDIYGNFTLNNVPEGAVLVVSYIGYVDRKIEVGSSSEITITIMEDTQKLDEVVVVGYGTQKKVNLTGSVSTISASDISSIPVSNISNAMAGRMPGVFAYNSSGKPGSSSPITIRGVNTPNYSSPAFVIDGVVRDKEDFDAIDPNEIETFSVLKDAASAAVYGSRAANGVILVTTKKGAQQKPMFRYSALVGTERETRRPEIMNAYNRTQYINHRLAYGSVDPSSTRYFADDEVEYFKTHDYDRLEMAWKNPLTHQHNLSVNGGSENIRYFMSAGYFDQDGVFDNVKYKKYNFRSNVDAKINNNLSLTFNIDANMNKNKTPYWPHNGTSVNAYGVSDNDVIKDLYRALMNHPRTEQPYVNGLPNATIYGWNVLEVIKSGGTDEIEKNTVNAQMSATYKIPFVEGLSAGAMFNYRKFYSVRKQVGKEYPLYEFETSGSHNHIVKDGAEITRVKSRTESLGNGIRKDFNENSRYTLNLQLNYDRTFGKHDVGALFLYEQYEQWGQNIYAQRKKLLTNAIEEMFIGDASAENKDAGGAATEIGRLGYVGRVNYAYDSKYLLEANFRYDASTKFASGNRWGFFPSVSAGWRISEETFMKDNEKLNFIDNLKLRLSYGVLGNDGGTDVAYYQYLDLFQTATGGAFGSATTGIQPSTYPNKTITWEKTATTDVGFDLGMWNGLLTFEFDYFYKRTYDILMARNRTIPSTFGASLPKENYAELINQGVEFMARHDNNIGDFKYYVSGNFSFARNHYSKIDEADNAYDYDLKKGRPMNFITGYLADGIARQESDLNGLPLWDGIHPWQLGDVILRDLTGDGNVTSIDKTVLSKYSKSPEIIYGFSLGGSWKGVDMNIFFQGVANRSIMPEYRGWKWDEQSVLNIWTDAYSNKSFNPNNPYMRDNLNGKYPRVNGTGSVGANGQSSSFWLLNGNYLRCKNLEVGYTFPKNIINKVGVDGLRVYFSGTNLFVFDHVNVYDPENSSNWDAYQYPLMKSFNFGLNLTF